jgi:hypothetical protein
MKKSSLAQFVLLLTISTRCFAVDDVAANGPEVIIQAEDCAIVALSGGYTVAAAPPQWQAQGDVVSISTAAGGLDYGHGDIKFSLAGPIPDGDYTLSVKWHTAVMSGEAWAFMIDADTGTVSEGSYASGNWHTFYPGKGDSHDDQWYTDELAGPAGLTMFDSYPLNPVRPYLTLSGIGNNDLHIRISDMALGEDNYFSIDYFVLQPVTVTNKSIHIEAEDCTITAGGANSYWKVDGQWVYVATSPSGNSQSATGNVAFPLPRAIPDGQYHVRTGYRLGTWGQQASAFKIAPAAGSSGTITENGISNQNGWHTFYPDGYALYQIDEMAGPAGLSFPVSAGTPIAQSVTVSNIGADEFVIFIWDQSGGNYNFFGIDFFELIPIEP